MYEYMYVLVWYIEYNTFLVQMPFFEPHAMMEIKMSQMVHVQFTFWYTEMPALVFIT